MENHPSRNEAYALLYEYNKQESLIRHGLTVEAVMRHFAEISGDDIEKWGLIGLCHDLDYEQFPEQHCTMTRKILEEKKWNTRTFAAGANRDVIAKGADMLGMTIEELVEETILAMQKGAETIGLKGNL